jgi:hypothetical protein
MPDRDVFRRNCKPGWQTAAQRMIGSLDDPDALPSVLRALGQETKANGCPGIDDIVSVLAEALETPVTPSIRLEALNRFESIRVQQGNANTEVAIASGRRLLASASGLRLPESGMQSVGEIRVNLTTAILADLADSEMCPAAVLHELIEDRKASFQEIEERRQRAKSLVAAASETRRLAVQLLIDPTGVSVKAPRVPREKRSQADILVIGLTE